MKEILHLPWFSTLVDFEMEYLARREGGHEPTKAVLRLITNHNFWNVILTVGYMKIALHTGKHSANEQVCFHRNELITARTSLCSRHTCTLQLYQGYSYGLNQYSGSREGDLGGSSPPALK